MEDFNRRPRPAKEAKAMTARATIPPHQQLVIIPEQTLLDIKSEISEIKILLARATIQQAPDWVPVREAARIKGVTTGTIRRKINSGELQAKGSGPSRLVKLPSQ